MRRVLNSSGRRAGSRASNTCGIARKRHFQDFHERKGVSTAVRQSLRKQGNGTRNDAMQVETPLVRYRVT